MRLVPYICIVAVSLMAACSNNDDDDQVEESDIDLTGRFVDSNVSGIGYSTASQSGETGINGDFVYLEGESVEFSIGETVFPVVRAREVVSPIYFSSDADIKDFVVINSAILLQSLDFDGDPENGIDLSRVDVSSSSAIDFSVSSVEFVQSPEVLNFIANSGGLLTEPVTSDDARNHLLDTLIEENERELSIDSVSEFIESGGEKLSSGQLMIAFPGNKYVSLDGRWDWEFYESGLSDSYALVEDQADFLDLPWSIEDGGVFCRRVDEVCVSVYRRGDVYRFGIEGDENALEPWAITPVR